jgi:3-oxoacyl-[acyl-carrier protein] reductase
MLLQGKNVVVYGAGSGIGSAVARTLAKEGANVFLAGRARGQLEEVARSLTGLGGRVEVASVDPLDPEAVERHLTYVVNEHGSLDLSINLAFLSMRTGTGLTGLSDEEFVTTSFVRARSNFVTGTAAARKMAYQGSGVVLAATLSQSGGRCRELAGLAIGSAAIETLFDQLDSEVGSRGVRVSCLRFGSVPERAVIEQVYEVLAPAGRTRSGTASEEPARLGRPSSLSRGEDGFAAAFA